MTDIHSRILKRLYRSYPEQVDALRIAAELLPNWGSLQTCKGLIELEDMGFVQCFESPNSMNYMLTESGLAAMTFPRTPPSNAGSGAVCGAGPRPQIVLCNPERKSIVRSAEERNKVHETQ